MRCKPVRIVAGIASPQDAEATAAFLSDAPESAEVLALAVVPRRRLLNTAPPHQWHVRAWQRSLKEAERLERDHASRLLEDFSSSVSSSVASVRTEVLGGNPSRQILAAARKDSADLIIVSRRQGATNGATHLGHVASRTARYAPCDVLVLDHRAAKPRTCLLATDGSAPARLAADMLRTLLARGRRTLLVCTIAPSFSPTFVRTGSFAYADYDRLLSDIREAQRAAAQATVDREGAAFPATAFDVKKLAYSGEAVAVLSRVVEEYGVDLLAIGARGLSAPSRFLLGSVAWRLLNRVGRSILIAR